jgi:phosphatidylethanolamine/phosphatidyl-N-methylethanolamine N-methyltransferase
MRLAHRQAGWRRAFAKGVALARPSLHGATVPGPVKDWLSFVQRMARNPRAVGAISPASAALAEAMAGQVDFALPGRVLELGPGTGAITKALVQRGLGPRRVLAVEADATFARMLRTRFPGLDVIEGDATDAEAIEGLGPFNAIISSLPLLNFPAHERAALVQELLRLVPPGAPFVQYSYGVKPPLQRSANLRVTLAAKVWRNLPPARIWVFQAKAADAPRAERVWEEVG